MLSTMREREKERREHTNRKNLASEVSVSMRHGIAAGAELPSSRVKTLVIDACRPGVWT